MGARNLSKPFVQVLLTKDSHYLNVFAVETVVDVIAPTDTAPISVTDLINSLVQQGLRGDFFELIEEGLDVPVSRTLPPYLKAVEPDAFQILFCCR